MPRRGSSGRGRALNSPEVFGRFTGLRVSSPPKVETVPLSDFLREQIFDVCVLQMGIDADRVCLALDSCSGVFSVEEGVNFVLSHSESHAGLLNETKGGTVHSETIFDTLPYELLHSIFEKIALKDLLNFSRCSRATAMLAAHHLSESKRDIVAHKTRLPTPYVRALIQLTEKPASLVLGNVCSVYTPAIVRSVERTVTNLDVCGVSHDDVSLEELQEAILDCSVLRRLAVSNSDFDEETWPYHPNLGTLLASNCRGMNDEVLTLTLQRCRLLQTATLSKCGRLSKDGMRSIEKYGSSLTSLDMSHCNRLSTISLTHLSLTVIRLNECPNLTTLSLQCPCLEELHLSNSKVLKRVTVTGSNNIRRIVATNCRSLEDIEVLPDPTVTKDGMEGPPWTCRLTELNCFGCRTLSNIGKVLEASPELMSLNLNGCLSIGLIQARLPRLVSLDCTGMKSLQVLDIGESTSLEDVRIAGCTSINAWRVIEKHAKLFDPDARIQVAWHHVT